MVSDRRRGVENSAVRGALVDAAETLIREAGYPAVTARNLADKLNLKRQIVHYYFNSMDDVFIAVVRKNTETMRAKLEAAMGSDEPLRLLQQINRDPAQAILSVELNALANRRPAVRAEVASAAVELRGLQTRVMVRHLEQRDITPGMQPVVATVLLTSLAQVLAVEAAIDVSCGHAETLEFVDACLRAFADGGEPPFSTVLEAAQSGQARIATAS